MVKIFVFNREKGQIDSSYLASFKTNVARLVGSTEKEINVVEDEGHPYGLMYEPLSGGEVRPVCMQIFVCIDLESVTKTFEIAAEIRRLFNGIHMDLVFLPAIDFISFKG